MLKRRYGDCKDKSLLLITLLKALGVESNPVLLSLERRKGLDKSLPSPAVFDHAIVQAKVNGKIFYLDPARLGQHGRLDRMGQAHEGAQVLIVSPETRQLVTVSSSNASDLFRSEISETASLPELNGEAELQNTQTWKGVGAESMRRAYQQISRDRIAKSFSDSMAQRYPGTTLIGEPEVQDDLINNMFTVTTRYAVPKLALEQDGYWYVRFVPSNLAGAVVSSPSPVRTAPLSVPAFPYEAKYSFEVKFPDVVSVMSDPHAHAVKGKYFTYSASAMFRGNVAKTTITFKTLADRVEASDLQKFTEDLTATNKAVGGAIVLPKQFVKSKKVAAAKKDVAQMVRTRLKDRIDKTTETINSGRVTGDDLADAYCSRGIAYVNLDQIEAAFWDFEEAIKLAPNSPKIHGCRAEAYFTTGEFNKSVSDYSQALSLGETGAEIFHSRGVSKFYSGKLEEAAEDFTKASAGVDSASQVFSDLWLAWTYQRLGKPLPPDLVERAAAQPRGDWPRPALATLNGHLTPEDLLKILANKSRDDRHLSAAEGYFYLGQFYLARGDKAKAREYFEKTRQLKVLGYTEHAAAGHELKALNADEPATTGALQASPGARARKIEGSNATVEAPAKSVRKKKTARDLDPDWSTKLLQ